MKWRRVWLIFVLTARQGCWSSLATCSTCIHMYRTLSSTIEPTNQRNQRTNAPMHQPTNQQLCNQQTLHPPLFFVLWSSTCVLARSNHHARLHQVSLSSLHQPFSPTHLQWIVSFYSLQPSGENKERISRSCERWTKRISQLDNLFWKRKRLR